MSRHMVPVAMGLAVFPLAAIGVAAYLLAAPPAAISLVAAAIFLLACGMFLAGGLLMMTVSWQGDRLAVQQTALQDAADGAAEILARLSALEDRQAVGSSVRAQVEHMAAETSILSRQVRDLMRSPRRADAPVVKQSARPEKKAGPPAAELAPAAAAPARRDELTLWLEPVIELAQGSTSHYRALIGLTDASGKTVMHDEVMQKADQSGLRPSIDARMMKMAVPVLRRIRLRRPDACIMLPVGRQTLGSRDEASKLLALFRSDEHLVDGLIFEFAQQDLGRLDAVGIENLARLARAGAQLALREVYAGGLDLAALRQLGVRYLSFPPYAADAGSGPSAAWTALVNTAKDLQISLVIDGVETRQQAVAAGKFARFGKGPYFALPRKVRPDAGQAPAAQRNATAA